jgi:predicted transcriptional regulator
MLTPYEIAVKSVIPAVRRMVAKQLIEMHKFTQQRAASLLGVSQSAISRYDTRERGVAIDLEVHPDVVRCVSELANDVAKGYVSTLMLGKRIDIICDYIIKHGYMCDFHREIDPSVSKDECVVCLENGTAVA